MVFQTSVLDEMLTVIPTYSCETVQRLKTKSCLIWPDRRLSAFQSRNTERFQVAKSVGLDIARALLSQPDILQTEPTTGLDIQTRKSIDLPHELQKEEGMTVVLTTQYLYEADEAIKFIYCRPWGSDCSRIGTVLRASMQKYLEDLPGETADRKSQIFGNVSKEQ